MTWWPGWDSIEGASWWGHFWFWFGIACLFLLGASEIVAFRYGQRKDTLVEIKDQQREAHTRQESDDAEARRAKEVAQLKEQLAEADKKSALLLEQQTPRRLSTEQKQSLIAALSPFPGQKISLVCLMNDTEGMQLSEDFSEVFKAAHWDYGGGCNQVVYTGPQPRGVYVFADGTVTKCPSQNFLKLLNRL